MSKHDQCPSTKGSVTIPEAAPELGRLNGRAYWRSLDEYAGTPEFRAFVEREFPSGASELLESSRRDFLKVMGAGLALAGAATVPGCRRPDRHILAYGREVPEEIVPGKALYYATAMTIPGGGAEGVLVETHGGRPTHIEGNPLHPISQGKTSVFSQACVLGLYDPDRMKFPEYQNPVRGRLPATWDDFAAWQATHFAKYAGNGGEGLAFLVEKKTSPTRDSVRDALLAKYPKARWVAWSPAETRGEIEGARIAFGAPVRVQLSLDKAKVVLSLDADFMVEGPDALRNARGFAKTREVYDAGEPMSRLYVAESRVTATGSMADHRFRMAPSRIAALAAAVARELAGMRGAAAMGSAFASADLSGEDLAHAKAIAEDLAAAGAGAVVLAGPSQPAEVHALAHAMNAMLGSIGPVVRAIQMGDEQASDSGAAFAQLTEAMNAGRVSTLVCIGTNPVYDAPACCDFVGAWAKVGATITLTVGASETAAASTWALNGQHELESWGDVEAHDGTISPVQPMIAPLYAPAMSEIEFLAMLNGNPRPDGYELLTRAWAAKLNTTVDGGGFDTLWRRALHNGVLENSAPSPQTPRVNAGAVAQAASRLRFGAAPTAESLEVVFHTGRVGDGRHANNGWLQELPEIGTTVVWDNPVCLSPTTARSLKLLPPATGQDDLNPYTRSQLPQGRLAELTIDGRTMEVAVWIQPGMPDGVAAVKLGYGRTVAGRVGGGVGHNTYKVRPASAGAASGATIRPTGETQTIASTQNHWSMESRTTIVRAMDKKWWDLHGAQVEKVKDKIYGTQIAALTVAEQIGELSHTPANVSIYTNPQNASKADADPQAQIQRPALNRATPPDFAKGPQWGMTIDLNTCTGCGVCTIACQSENNIPIVGKKEVAKGREMQWIRVDRYFTGDLENPDEILVQPVACVHCENAPCEVVCPVNATVHGPEGTNNMAYNRCIGTRYCANNCPYKVRRFNFFDWAQSKFDGGLDGKYVTDGVAKKADEWLEKNPNFNQNFIPPRLRAKMDEITKMQQNPDVTVRGRGVMEKCTYCIQRVNAARQEVKVRDIWQTGQNTVMGPGYEAPIPDGFFEVACQQACPTGAIVFGDILDPESRVSKIRESHRNYLLLGYLNTRPRTSHLMRVRNPNPAIRPFEEDPLIAHGGGGGDHGGDSHGGNGHGGGHGESGGPAAFIDRSKKHSDEGYAMSLRVLGPMGGVVS